MGRSKQTPPSGELPRFNRVRPATNAVISALFIALGLMAIVPFVFVVIISFSSEQSIVTRGYSFVPAQWSTYTYGYLWQTRDEIFSSFLTSVTVTVVGTAVGVVLIATMGYTLSRRNFRFRRLYTVLVFIPMLFNGGMVANYMVMTQLYGLKNSLWALILPLACSTFYIIITRTFFITTVPDSIVESAKIDGASQLKIFAQIVLPISLPALATVGLFLTFGFWNDWYQAMLYISERAKYPLQYLLVSIEKSVDFLSRSDDYILTTANNLPSETVRMAIVVISVLPIACSYPFFQKYFVSGLTVGAVKG